LLSARSIDLLYLWPFDVQILNDTSVYTSF